MLRIRAGYLLADRFQAVSKKILIDRFSNTDYPYREVMLEYLAWLDLSSGDLSHEILEWLITKMDFRPKDSPFWTPVAQILGKVSNETIVYEKLIPLLTSSNKIVRDNAYQTIKIAERQLGKRFLKE